MDDVQCTSSASQLLECPSRPILSHNCHHSDDAGVGCEGMFFIEKIFTLLSSDLELPKHSLVQAFFTNEGQVDMSLTILELCLMHM